MHLLSKPQFVDSMVPNYVTRMIEILLKRPTPVTGFYFFVYSYVSWLCACVRMWVQYTEKNVWYLLVYIHTYARTRTHTYTRNIRTTHTDTLSISV